MEAVVRRGASGGPSRRFSLVCSRVKPAPMPPVVARPPFTPGAVECGEMNQIKQAMASTALPAARGARRPSPPRPDRPRLQNAGASLGFVSIRAPGCCAVTLSRSRFAGVIGRYS